MKSAYTRLRHFRSMRMPRFVDPIQRAVQAMLDLSIKQFAEHLDGDLMGGKRSRGYHEHHHAFWLADGWLYSEPCDFWKCKDTMLVGMVGAWQGPDPHVLYDRPEPFVSRLRIPGGASMRRRRVNFDTFLPYALARLRETIPILYEREHVFCQRLMPPRGRKGPVTFTGTPAEVIRAMRRYQRGAP